ncbi:MAG TPA: hypothetical protein VGO47_08715 [Chlamydiales bacterium]|nr:hypothetical protein [Chlamydiales bacterium]
MAELDVFVPLDKDDHRAIVVPRGTPHNHPAFPERKASATAIKKYREAVRAVGPLTAMVGKVDNGEQPSTSCYWAHTEYNGSPQHAQDIGGSVSSQIQSRLLTAPGEGAHCQGRT